MASASEKQTEAVKPPTEVVDATESVATNTPVIESTPAVESTPVVANTPVVASNPVTSDTPVTSNAPVMANTSGNEGLSVTCSRTLIANSPTSYLVEISVNKGNLAGFAKLLETLPAGFTAVSGESKGASFSFNDQKVKFVWVSLPADPEFMVSYKITIAASAFGSGDQPVDGIFSFIENDETKRFTIPTNIIALGSSSSSSPTLATNTVKPTEVPAEKATTPVVADNTKLAATNIPKPQGKVNYRVQIAALHNAVDAGSLAARYNLNESVITEMAQGFTKYTVGSHVEYKAAHDAREVVKNRGVVGPFVTAYNYGTRITVQEALMITSQKWFR